ncbi:hypothetical protein [Streptantibioticus ferralitis]|uniref:Uncharacterized protein n=1 Tax=Streptantibioticus ferralitis TaxID=236510 RepID=A0ABT5ZCX6_9ACTN|nr:hypothetical protein [Streptantibioticus ferralitis]MDF2261538.1 hypothetical protein [Streptantibioticus ferralitis]
MTIFALAFLVTRPYGIAYSLRLAGTPDTFQVLYCRQVPSGRSTDTVCDGTFQSADRRIVDDDASLWNEVEDFRLGERVPVTRAAASDYHMAR